MTYMMFPRQAFRIRARSLLDPDHQMGAAPLLIAGNCGCAAGPDQRCFWAVLPMNGFRLLLMRTEQSRHNHFGCSREFGEAHPDRQAAVYSGAMLAGTS